MKKLFTLLAFFVTLNAFSQGVPNTTTLPSSPASLSFNQSARWWTSTGVYDTLAQTWINGPTGFRRYFSAAEWLKYYYPIFKQKSDSTGATGYLQRGSLFPLGDTRYARIGGGTLTYTHTMAYGLTGGNFNNSGNITSKVDTSLLQTILNFYPLADRRYALIGGGALTYQLSAGYGISGSAFNNTVNRTWGIDTGNVFGIVSKGRLATNLGGYLKTATAASTYQTLANIENTVTNSSTLYTSGSAVSKVRDSTFNINKNLYDAVDKTAVRYNISALKNNLTLWDKVRALFGNGVIYFGDSITYGQGASIPSLCYAYLLNAMFGGSMVNNAISGNGVREQNVPLLQTAPLVHGRTSLALYSVGINDIRYFNTTDVQIKYPSRGALNFLLTAFSGSETLSGSLTTTGTWTTYNAQSQTGAKSNGIKSTTFGDYITYNTTTEKGFYFFAIGGQNGSENFATVQVQIDGVVIENVDTHSGYCQNTNVVDLGFFYPLDGAAHTIKLINNSSGGQSMVIDYVGTLKNPSACVPAAVADIGMVNQASMITGTPAIINSANDYINIQVGRLRKLDYPAISLHTNDYFQTTNTVDGIHPNDAGYAQIANGHYATITDQNYVPNLIVDNFTARTLTGFPIASETNDGIITAEKYKAFKSSDVSLFADSYVPYTASGKLAVDGALMFDPSTKITSVYQLGLTNSRSAISTSVGASIYSTLGGFSYPFSAYGNIIIQAGSNTGSLGYDIDFVTGTSRTLSGYMKGSTGEFNWGYTDGLTHAVSSSILNVNGGISVSNSNVAGSFNRSGNISSVAWGLAGVSFNSNAANYTDTSTPASGSITNANITAFGRPTISATNTGVTIDGATTVDIVNSPLAGTNVTLTNPLSLQVRAGLTKLATLTTTGAVVAGTTLSVAGVATLNGGTSSSNAANLGMGTTASFATLGFLDNAAAQKGFIGYAGPSAASFADMVVLASNSKVIGLSTNGGSTFGFKLSSNTVSFPLIASAAGIAHIDITTGNVTNSLIATADISANAVTYAKMQAMTTNKILGSGAGTAVSEISTTGSGNVVLATSPTLVTPILGTIASGNGAALTSLTAANLSGTVPTANLGSGTANSSTFLRGDGTWAAPSISADTHVLYTNQADFILTNNNAEFSVIPAGPGSLTLPIATTGKQFRALIGGVYSTPAITAGSFIVNVYYGSTLIATGTASGLLAGASRLSFSGNMKVSTVTVGGSGTVYIDGGLDYSVGNNLARFRLDLNNTGNTVTVANNATQTFDIKMQWDTASVNKTIDVTSFSLESLN